MTIVFVFSISLASFNAVDLITLLISRKPWDGHAVMTLRYRSLVARLG